jgi:hypothetical protein
MQTVFALFSLESVEPAAADLISRLGTDAVNVLVQDTVKTRLGSGRAQPVAPEAGAAPVVAPTLAHLLSRKRPVFLAEAGSILAVHSVAEHISAMAQSTAPTKTQGSLKVALEEYGVRTYYAEAYATGVAHGYVLLFAEVPEEQIMAVSEQLRTHGGREVFNFQRLD